MQWPAPRSALSFSAFVLLASPAAASEYPVRPIRMIVPQAAGSSSDVLARVVAAALTLQLGQQVIVDNRPGLMLGLGLIAHAPPDGYTIGTGPVGLLAIMPHVIRDAPIDVQKDLQPIVLVTNSQMLLVASVATSFKSVRDVVEFAKQYPGKLSNASSGNGSPGHVGFELFKHMTATNIVHVSYKGGGAAVNDLISGQVQLMMESLLGMTQHVKSGRVRALAVSGASRSPAFPELPTIAQAGVPGYEANTWTGVIAPASMPKSIAAILNAQINFALATQSLKEKIALIGAEPAGGTPEHFGAVIRKDSAKWSAVVKRSGAKAD